MIIMSYGTNGKSAKEIDPLIRDNKVGGIIYLKGSRRELSNHTLKLNKLNNNGLPLIYSMDAEPSLMNGRITDLAPYPKTSTIKTIAKNNSIATQISNELLGVGVRLNFAPDCDMGTSNAAIGSRSYGDNTDDIVAFANSFISTSTDLGIVTCAKHFPGHGLVKGDSHHQRVFIDGELKELDIYKKLLKNDQVLSVMVGHIDIINNAKYNTNGIPSSCSPKIIKDLLKTELGFKGLVISDALDMKALSLFKIAGLEASKAGCDFLCMPKDANTLIDGILLEAQKDKTYAQQIETSIKKIIRLKICLNYFPNLLNTPLIDTVLSTHNITIKKETAQVYLEKITSDSAIANTWLIRKNIKSWSTVINKKLLQNDFVAQSKSQNLNIDYADLKLSDIVFNCIRDKRLYYNCTFEDTITNKKYLANVGLFYDTKAMQKNTKSIIFGVSELQ